MRVCLSNRNTIEYLRKADEIKVRFYDYKAVPDYFEDYPDKNIILDLNVEQGFDPSDESIWNELRSFSVLGQGKFICCVEDLFQMEKCKELDIKFYYGYPVNSFYELNALVLCGVCYVRVAPPLSHSLDKVARFNIPVRAVPNVCYQGYLPHENGIHGQWIRPEDLTLYNKYIDIIEFEDCDRIEKEQALYRIYMEEHEWPGDFDMLYTNFNYKGVNRMLDSDLALRRMTCGQTCEAGGFCRLCDRYIDLADEEKWIEYNKAMNKQPDEVIKDIDITPKETEEKILN